MVASVLPEEQRDTAGKGKLMPEYKGVKGYVTMLAEQFNLPAAKLTVAHGRAFPEMSPNGMKYKPGAPKHCFWNAYELAARTRGKLRYVEGYANGGIPMEHAWCVDEHDRVIDPTWRPENGQHDDGDREYFGVVIPLPIVKLLRAENKGFGNVLQIRNSLTEGKIKL